MVAKLKHYQQLQKCLWKIMEDYDQLRTHHCIKSWEVLIWCLSGQIWPHGVLDPPSIVLATSSVTGQ
ncbi:Uncharacterized protein TCM_003344 [Theobroma cacao]|uniref:Uncharacterized protein n=1 Tax=Theobroma cacao TaxID=3641 RepID=A0A061DNY4_THECC|nr:Uncharacterized protein TCM_003344 [Theobroma cacao]